MLLAVVISELEGRFHCKKKALKTLLRWLPFFRQLPVTPLQIDLSNNPFSSVLVHYNKHNKQENVKKDKGMVLQVKSMNSQNENTYHINRDIQFCPGLSKVFTIECVYVKNSLWTVELHSIKISNHVAYLLFSRIRGLRLGQSHQELERFLVLHHL